ncbi:hypothetical protein [Campylobacter lanienae]|uniref:putative barnase/colicin E5 family endoribonuclease n=1 Tax=Campylobacter lanienae TaxID=75658 RepID=UPI001F1B5700|nr:hypothetical protein [Campylobacter lanienae]
MAEFILLNKAILNANGDFKLAIKNIDNIPDGNLPTPTRNLLNEFKEAVKEIEKQVVKTDNQPNLANQANSGNIDSLTKQISYLQNALKNQSKDAPTPSTATKEADSLSQATPNLTQNSIKGDGFVTYPQTATQKYPYNAFLDIEKDLATELNLPQAQIRASLQYLWDNHAKDGMFKNKRDVYNTIKMLIGYQDYAGNSFKNPNMAYIATKTSDNKMSDMAINRDSGGVVHLNKDKKMSQTDKKNLNNEPMAETPKSQRKQQVLGVQMNTSKEHFSSANTETIPNQTIKQAETIAKTAEPQTTKAKEPMATTAKPQEPTPQATKEADKKAKLDEELAKNKAYVEGLERDAISKIEALHNFNKTKVKAEVTISSKSIISQAEQELKEFAKSIGNSQEQIDKFSLKGIQHLRSYLNDLGSYFYRTKNQRAQDIADKYNKMLDDMAKIRATKKDIKSQKDEQRVTLVNEAIESFRKLWFSDLKSYSNFLIKYGKTDEFMTKANPKWKSEFDEVRASMERKQNIQPIKEFGTNYAEFYHDGENAIKKLLTERQGQVAGAFEREELGDIDLVWGEVTDAIKHKGYGLSHILDKRMAEFMEQGLSKEQAEAKAIELINKLPDIIKNGEIVENAGVNTIILKEGNSEFRAGLSKGFFGKGDNQWVITSYEKRTPTHRISTKLRTQKS